MMMKSYDMNIILQSTGTIQGKQINDDDEILWTLFYIVLVPFFWRVYMIDNAGF